MGDVMVPVDAADCRRCYDIICQELSFNVFTEDSRAFFAGLCRSLHASGAQGVVLGCTEIELLLKVSDVPEVPVFCSAELRIAAAARVAAGQANVTDYEPHRQMKRKGSDESTQAAQVCKR